MASVSNVNRAQFLRAFGAASGFYAAMATVLAQEWEAVPELRRLAQKLQLATCLKIVGASSYA